MEDKNVGTPYNRSPNRKVWETPKLIIEDSSKTMGGGGNPSPGGDDVAYDS